MAQNSFLNGATTKNSNLHDVSSSWMLSFKIPNQEQKNHFPSIYYSTKFLLFNFLKAQRQNPLKGDWAPQVEEDLKDFDLNYSLEKIKQALKTEVTNAMKVKEFELLQN